MKNKKLERRKLGLDRVITLLTACSLVTLLAGCCSAPLQATPTPSKSMPPKPTSLPTFVYVPVPQPVNSIQQYRQKVDGSLEPLKPFRIATQSPNVPVSATDPTHHFVYLGTSPLRQFRIGGTGQLVSLKPATVSLPEANEMAFTPNGRFLYLIHSKYNETGEASPPDDLIICRVDKNETVHPVQLAVVHTGIQVSALAVDHTGQFLYVCVHNYDPSGRRAYIMEYHIHKDGTLTHLKDDYNCMTAPFVIKASSSGPFMYIGSHQGLSAWQIKSDGTLHLLQSNLVAMSVPTFAIDARDNLIIGVGEAVSEDLGPTDLGPSDFSADRLLIWRQEANGTLSEIYVASVGDDGFLYADEKDMKERKPAFPVGLAYDPEQSLLYVRDRSTDRIFRYAVVPSGLLQLKIPWLNTGVTGIEKLYVGFGDNPIFLGR